MADVRALGMLVIVAAACGGDGGSAPGVRMSFSRAGGLYDAPFPSEDLRRGGGRIDLSAFPNPGGVVLVEQLRALAAEADGFSTTSAVYFQLEATPDVTRLPSVHGSMALEATVFLVDVERRARHPVTTFYEEDGGPHGAPHLLSLLPVQGLPLRPSALHAAVVTRGLGDASGGLLSSSPAVTQIAHGNAPAGLDGAALDDYRTALAALGEMGTAADDIAGLAVFRTGDPTATLRAARAAAPVPAVTAPFRHLETYDTYCVFEAEIEVPVYQQGEPPFESAGGGWTLDAAGVPIEQRRERARLFVTLPRTAPPPAGFPLTVFIRTGGGGDRPLIDRGLHAEPHGPAIAPGSGPALELAAVGFAGASADGPHGGIRNVSGGDEQFLVFNVQNPPALRDNIRQSALETALLVDVLLDAEIDPTGCPDLTGPVRFDGTRLALMGHSMGATIAPLVLAIEPRFGAVVLSGAGGSFIENIVYKQSPIEVRPYAELVLRYGRRMLHEHDAALSLFQWAAEPADPPVYAPAIGQHVLMLQGIVDTYILPPIANATSLSLALDLAGEPLDQATPELDVYTPLAELQDLAGAGSQTLPSTPDEGGRTRIVIQHPEDGIEDGHEVVFQTDAPKRQYRCFLDTLRPGTAPVVCP